MSGFGIIDIVFHDIPATLLLVRPVFPSRFGLDKEDADLVVKCCCLSMFAHEKAFHLIESVRVPGGKEQDFHGYVSNVFRGLSLDPGMGQLSDPCRGCGFVCRCCRPGLFLDGGNAAVPDSFGGLVCPGNEYDANDKRAGKAKYVGQGVEIERIAGKQPA